MPIPIFLCIGHRITNPWLRISVSHNPKTSPIIFLTEVDDHFRLLSGRQACIPTTLTWCVPRIFARIGGRRGIETRLLAEIVRHAVTVWTRGTFIIDFTIWERVRCSLQLIYLSANLGREACIERS